ncbi:MAG TPA: universal stress protein [Mycobacteriales bacterium]|nr:universal stress protein [Mycobacteriales bacterium]
MPVLIWVADGTWPATVDAARALAPAGADLILLHVTGDEAAAAHAAFSGLLGRGAGRDPGPRLAALADEAAAELLDRAAERLGRPAALLRRHGRAESAVLAEAAGADLLVLARDGDRSRRGPRSLGPATRFIVDHAPCPVLLVWPEPAPAAGPPEPPPPPPHHPPGPPHPP